MKVIPKFDLRTVRDVIAGDFPDVKIESIKLIENGWDNVVAEINKLFIFRFPKNFDGSEYRGIGKNFDREIKILNFLNGKISLAIPKIEFIGKTFAYTGYKKIPGDDLTQEVFGSLNEKQKEKLIFDLANFLREIHNAIGIEEARAMGVDDANPMFYFDLIKDKLPRKINDPRVFDFIDRMCGECEEMTKEKTETVFLYNDLHTENMAFDAEAKKLNGIFDFGDTMIGDINMDFSPLYRFDPYFMKAVAENYQKLTNRTLNLRRMIVYGRINELSDLTEFIDQPESAVYKNVMNRIKKWRLEMDLFSEFR